MASRARHFGHGVEVHARPAQQVDQGVLVFQRFAQQAFGFGCGQRGGAHPGGAKALQLALQAFALEAEGGPAGVVHQPQLAAGFGQAQVGVVFAQLQAELGAAGEHAVGLGHALGHQVIHQHAQVRLITPRQPGVAPLHLKCRVHRGIKPLRRGLFIAGRAVDLAGKEQALNGPCLEAGPQLARVEVVVFNGITRPQDVRPLQAGHALHRGNLHVEGQGGGNAVGIELVRRQAFGFQKDLVRVLVGKAIDLVLDARAVARPHAADDPGEHRAAVKAAADDLVRARIGVRDPARHLPWVLFGAAQKTEHRHRVQVARLFLQLAEIDAAAVDAWRRAGLEPALRELELLQASRKAHCRRVTGAAGAVVLQAHVDAAIQKGARGQHHSPRPEAHAHLRDGTHHAVAFQHQVINGLLEEPQDGLVLQPVPNGRLVEDAISLCPCRAHGRALAAVEDAELDAGFVGRRGHGTAQRVHLLHEVSLADAADAGVAAHLPQRLDVVRQQQRRAAHARGGQGGLGARVATANNDDVKRLRVQHAAILRRHPSSPRRHGAHATTGQRSSAPRC